MAVTPQQQASWYHLDRKIMVPKRSTGSMLELRRRRLKITRSSVNVLLASTRAKTLPRIVRDVIVNPLLDGKVEEINVVFLTPIDDIKVLVKKTDW